MGYKGFEVKDLNAVDLFIMTKAEKTEPVGLPEPKLPEPKQGEIQKRSMELIEGLRKLASPDATAMAEKAMAMAKKKEEGDQQAESDAAIHRGHLKRDRGASSSGSSSAAPKATANAKKRKANAAAGEAEAAASSKKKGKRKA